MLIFKCILLSNFIVFSIALPIENKLSTKNEKSIKDSSPPLEFPQNDSQFPVVDANATLLNELSGDANSAAAPQESIVKSEENILADNEYNSAAIDSKIEMKDNTVKQIVDESKIDTEVADLLTIEEDLIEPPLEPDVKIDSDSSDNEAPSLENRESISEEPINVVISTSTEDFPKGEVEWIQNGHDNEDVRLLADDDSFPPSSDYIREAYSEHGRGVPLVQGRYAAILACVFIVMAVVGYALMLSWRRYLENRYGNRQMLINEEDIFSANDMKHFSL